MGAVIVLGIYLSLLGAGALLDALWPPLGWSLLLAGVGLTLWGSRRRASDAP